MDFSPGLSGFFDFYGFFWLLWFIGSILFVFLFVISQVDKRILVTGGKGFLGKHLVRKLEEGGYRHIFVADLPEYNLVNIGDVQRMYKDLIPDIVIHLAAKVGGIGFNQQNPASLFYENAMMGIQLLREGYVRQIQKFVALGTICAYPKFTPVPF